MIKDAVVRGYLRRGLIQVLFNTEEGAAIERRLYFVDMRAAFVVPLELLDKLEDWEPSKEDFQETVQWVHRVRAEKAARLRKARRLSFSDALTLYHR